MIAVHTTAEALRTARQGTERALVGLTADVVAGKRALIESALASGRALGPLALERLDDPQACGALLSIMSTARASTVSPVSSPRWADAVFFVRRSGRFFRQSRLS
jgi:hypothetical protein